MRGKEEIKKTIEEGKAVLGIEFGSTRIKAVLIDEDKSPIASGSYDWENQLVDNVWTYSMEKIQSISSDVDLSLFNPSPITLLSANLFKTAQKSS